MPTHYGTPQGIAQQRRLADLLQAQRPSVQPTGVLGGIGAGIGGLGRALAARNLRRQATEAETAGRERAAQSVQGLGTGSDLQALLAAGSDPFASPAQQNLVNTLISRKLAPPAAPPSPVSVAPGSTLVDPRTGKAIFTAPPKADTTISSRPLTPDERKTYGIPETDQAPYQIDSRGKVSRIGVPATVVNVGDKGLTESQSKAAQFADVINLSSQVLDDPAYADVLTSISQRALAASPVAPNLLTSGAYREADQAKRAFINATLRRESGAVISDSEFENAEKQYFPQPGDGPRDILRKQRNREIVKLSIQRAAGPNYEPIELEPLPPIGADATPGPAAAPQTSPPPAGADGWQDLGGGVRIRLKGGQ